MLRYPRKHNHLVEYSHIIIPHLRPYSFHLDWACLVPLAAFAFNFEELLMSYAYLYKYRAHRGFISERNVNLQRV